MSTLFVVLLKYIVPLETVTAARPAHLAFLDQYYANKVFIASGRQVPPTGGIILARADNKVTLENILAEDPFAQQNLAEYQIYEWDVSKCSKVFATLLS
jgi:uncharacterized protein YciI